MSFSKASSSKQIPLVKKEEPFDGDHQEVELKPEASTTSKPLPTIKKEVDSKDALKRKLGSSKAEPPKKKSALDQIIEEQERWKERKSVKKSTKPETWLLEGIMVRVVTKDLGKEYYNKKATVEKLVDEYGAVIRMLDSPSSSATRVQVDEQHLETVVPKEGCRVAVLKGLYRGRKATIASIDIDREKVQVLVDNAAIGGRTVSLSFDDVSKLA